MSRLDCPTPNEDDSNELVETLILPRTNDIGGFEVSRALPSRKRRMVGPFIFFDQMGPGEFITGKGLDVRPHPHINLSTVTYLFEGEIDHRDSLGTYQTIKPGAVNLMTAGKGITHSERSGKQQRENQSELFGIQSWLALPEKYEEISPNFSHHAKTDLPIIEDNGIQGRLIMGNYERLSSLVPMHHETLYMDLKLSKGKKFSLNQDMAEERAIYPLTGVIKVGDTHYEAGRMLILHPNKTIDIEAIEESRMVIIGGATMDSKRYIWWNFVSSSKERIEQAKEDWKMGRFDAVPEDSEEFIPLPQK